MAELKSKYISARDLTAVGKTRNIEVKTVSTHQRLGLIQWHKAWRQYVFHPWGAVLFNHTCLKEIAKYLDELTKEHKNANGLRETD